MVFITSDSVAHAHMSFSQPWMILVRFLIPFMIERVVNFVNYVQNFDVNLMYTDAGDISILLANVSIIEQTSH